MSEDGPYAPPKTPLAVETAPGQSGITDRMVRAVNESRIWVLIITLLSGFATLLIVIAALFFLVAGQALAEEAGLPTTGMALMYAFGALLYLLVTVKLWRIWAAMRRFKSSVQARTLEEVLETSRGLWRTIGIMATIMVALYGGLFLVLMLVGLAGLAS